VHLTKCPEGKDLNASQRYVTRTFPVLWSFRQGTMNRRMHRISFFMLSIIFWLFTEVMISLLWSSGLWLAEFRETCCLHIHLRPKATGSAFFPKVSNHLPHYKVPYVTQLQRKRFTALCYGKKKKKHIQSSLTL